MQQKFRPIIVASAALLFVVSALAQDASAPAKKADDRSSQTVTPVDQGNNKADLTMTAQIRKDVVAEKNLSVNAHNVKIVTNAGKVTLRGPVNTAEEKRLIGDIAGKYAQPENVDNQLEVKVSSTSSLMDQTTAPKKP